MSFCLRQSINLAKVFLGIPAPIYVQLPVTKSCTMRCRMCHATEARAGDHELDIEQMEKLARVLRSMGVGFIVLTGGEPLLRADLADIVAAFKRERFTVRIQSNGTLFTIGQLTKLRDAGLDGITISLHSLSAEKMAFITGVPRALDKIFDALCAYTQVFPMRNHIHGINTVVSAYNIEEVPRLVDFVSRIGFSISLIPVHLAQDRDFIVRGQDAAFVFGAQHASIIETVYDTVIGMKRSGSNIYNSERFLRESKAFLHSSAVQWKCESPDLYFSISPSGTFLPCVDLAGDVSMLAPDFLRIWKSREFKARIRTQVEACEGCMYACYPEFSYLLNSKAFFIRRSLEYRRMTSVRTGPLTRGEIERILSEIPAHDARGATSA